MAKRKPQLDNNLFPLDPEHRKKLADTMMLLATRSKVNESLIMQLAKAGELTEVVKELTRMRNYVKRMVDIKA